MLIVKILIDIISLLVFTFWENCQDCWMWISTAFHTYFENQAERFWSVQTHQILSDRIPDLIIADLIMFDIAYHQSDIEYH